jgi:hypothetical protein
MRKFKLVQLLVVAALLVVPVAAIGAQSGTLGSDRFGECVNGFVDDGSLIYACGPEGMLPVPVAPSSLPQTGISQGTGQCVNGFLDDGSLIYACGPEGTSPVPVAPSSLPQSGSGGQAVTSAGGFVWDGASDWTGVTDIVLPEALPEAGADASKPPFYAALPTYLSGQTPGSLPETGAISGLTGRDRQVILDQMAVRGMSVGSALGVAATRSSVNLDGITERERQTIMDQLAASGVSVTSGEPAALPQSGVDFGGLTGRDRQVILDQMAARGASAWGAPVAASASRSVNLDGVTGRDRQTIIDQLAASGVSVTSGEPAALPETGASGAGIGWPSDPPLIGDWAQAAESVMRRDASISDPPILDMFNR